MKEPKIAIIYDWLDKWGGIERVLLILAEIFPSAIFYTSTQDKSKAVWSQKLNVKTSFIQNLPDLIKKNRLFSLVFYPFAFESFDLSEYDLVLSVSSSFAKSVITKPSTTHISLSLTPTRFLWVHPETRILARPYLKLIKIWDRVASYRPDYYISISKTVAERIKKYYHQDSKVIYPPFDIDYWSKIKSKAKGQSSIVNCQLFYLVVSRLEPYKRIDLVIDVFNKLDKHLVIVGTGTLEKNLKKRARANIRFFSNISDLELSSFYKNAQAVIMPQEEDFGLVSLEAQFFGCPVIAYAKGGAQETVNDGKTGIFFDKQTINSLSQTLAKFEEVSYTLHKSTKIHGPKMVDKFSKKIFINNLRNLSYLSDLK